MALFNRYLFLALCFSLMVSSIAAAESLTAGQSSSITTLRDMPDNGSNAELASTGTSLEYTRASFGKLVEMWNTVAPYIGKIIDGLEVSGVEMEGDDINFNYTCSRFNAYAISIAEDKVVEVIKKESAKAFYEVFTLMGNDDRGKSLLDEMVTLGLKVNYNFFVKGSEQLIKTVTITATDIQDAGKVKQYQFAV